MAFGYKKEPSANSAAIKAFIVNRVGDFGFALGMLCNLRHLTGSVYFDDLVFNQAETTYLKESFLFLGINFNKVAVNLICILLFIGAMGKVSSNYSYIPGLPDAMEGPTPVSALNSRSDHGYGWRVFLICKMFSPLMEFSSTYMQHIVTVVGMQVLLYLPHLLVWCRQILKRVIAYSTC